MPIALIDSTTRTSRLGRIVLVPAVAAVGLAVSPGTASAQDPVTPLVSCVMPVENGYWTAVFGYHNATSVTQRQPIGGDNDFDPDDFNGPQTTVFEPGVRQGAFAVRVPRAQDSIEWELYDSRVTARRDAVSTACPASTQMPADGNGTGVVVALGAAGVVGAVALGVTRRRSASATGDRTGSTPAV